MDIVSSEEFAVSQWFILTKNLPRFIERMKDFGVRVNKRQFIQPWMMWELKTEHLVSERVS